jgi:hypothetical protein
MLDEAMLMLRPFGGGRVAQKSPRDALEAFHGVFVHRTWRRFG